MCNIRSAFNKFPDFFERAFKIVIDSWKFTMLLLYILWDDWPIFIISASNEQLQQQLEYTLQKPDCHCWWISKMQSGSEDILEERYAIKLWFKLGKNATETYGMLQTAFQPSSMNQASVFEWHKRFKEGRESVRDDERCGKSKEVRTPELIGQIKNFMDKDCRVSIETIKAQFDISVGTVHTIIHEELKMRKICAKFFPRVLREDQKERRCHDSREMVELIHSDPAVLDALVTCNERWIYCYDQETEFPVKVCWLSQTQEGQTEQIHPTNFWWSFFLTAPVWSTYTGFPLDRQSTRNTMLRFLGSSARDSVRRGQYSSNRVSGISTRTMHQSTTPSLSQTILPRWASRQFLSLPIVQTLLSVTFGYSLSSRKTLEAVVMRQLRRWKRLWQRSLICSHKRTSMGPSRSCWNGTTSALQPEEITSKGTRVSCVYYQ